MLQEKETKERKFFLRNHFFFSLPLAPLSTTATYTSSTSPAPAAAQPRPPRPQHVRVQVRERRREQHVEPQRAEGGVGEGEVEVVGHLDRPELAFFYEGDRGLDQRHLPGEDAQRVKWNESRVPGPREGPGGLAVGGKGRGGVPRVADDVGGGPGQEERHERRARLELRHGAHDQEEDVGAAKPLEEGERGGALGEGEEDVEGLEEGGELAEAWRKVFFFFLAKSKRRRSKGKELSDISVRINPRVLISFSKKGRTDCRRRAFVHRRGALVQGEHGRRQRPAPARELGRVVQQEVGLFRHFCS